MNYISFKAVTRFELNAEIHRFLDNHPGIEIINMSYSTHNQVIFLRKMRIKAS